MPHWPQARWESGPALRWPTATPSTSSSAAGAGTALIRTRRSTRSCRPPNSFSRYKPSSAASDNVRELLLRGIARKAKAIAAGAKAPEPTITVGAGTPALENDARLTARVEDVFRGVFGGARVVPAEQSMGAEDFSRYGRAGGPVLMFRLGTVTAARLEQYRDLGQTPPSLHSPLFYPDPEPTLETGVVAMTSAALELLR
jgi:metal-dependent amidase/aminoacylase/carboxypeptidase family protein